jgi:hypothetical protein
MVPEGVEKRFGETRISAGDVIGCNRYSRHLPDRRNGDLLQGVRLDAFFFTIC